MTNHRNDFFAAILMGFLLPALILALSHNNRGSNSSVSAQEQTTQCAIENCEETVSVIGLDDEIMVLDMETYVTGVVLGEMPASFMEEALKAQAVAARTYAAKMMETGGKHGEGKICVNPSCCQAYLSKADYLESTGDISCMQKVCDAVAYTAGQVLSYHGELIEAPYFSCAGGSTEDAVEVWGTEAPYLHAVLSQDGDAASQFDEVLFFNKKSLESVLQVSLPNDPALWIQDTTYSNGGGVSSVQIGGRIFSGTELRNKLSLRSTIIETEVSEGGILIRTKGYGHRVGMSQYGAESMACAGKTYREILEYYYSGTEIRSYPFS